MSITKGPLSHIRIVDLTQAYSGPFGTMLLGDLGAEIIKIEPPVGDMMRFGENQVNPSQAYALSLGRNKKSIVLDLASGDGKKTLYDLIKISDVVMSNNRADVPKRQGTDFETLKKINPEIIRCNITGYGESGPCIDYPAYDITACGYSGILSISGEPGQSPVIPGGVAIADMTGGIFAAFSVLAALVKRAQNGKGMKVETNLLDGMLVLQQVIFQKYFFNNQEPGPQGRRHTLISPYGIYKTCDGFIAIGASDSNKVVGLVGLEWMLEDERFKDTPTRLANEAEFDKFFEKALQQKTTAAWVTLLRDKNDIACGPVNKYQDVVDDPQVHHNNMVVEMEVNGEKYNSIGSMFKFPDELEGTPDPPPNMGQHTKTILKNLLNYSDKQINTILEENKKAIPRLQKRIKTLN